MTDAKDTGFIFLWWAERDDGVFVTQENFELLNRYYYALHAAPTWGRFLELLGPFKEFVLEFTQCDEYEPRIEDRIEDIRNDVWVLYDCEFPITQCADDTYSSYKSVFPGQYCSEVFRTEYGNDIGFYLKSGFPGIELHLARSGYRVTPVRSPFPRHIYDYR